MKALGVIILALFYSIYLGKMVLQKRKGIQTDQIAKGKRDQVFYTELIMKIATYSVVLVEIGSILFCKSGLPWWLVLCGVVIAFAGDVIFAVAVGTMKDSWRAGIAENDKTKIITNGIYSVSRNPAFVAFDCVYIGLLLMFFNIPLLLFSLFAIVMLHLQIVQEEAYLPKAFGAEYIDYKKKVCRYLGRRR